MADNYSRFINFESNVNMFIRIFGSEYHTRLYFITLVFVSQILFFVIHTFNNTSFKIIIRLGALKDALKIFRPGHYHREYDVDT